MNRHTSILKSILMMDIDSKISTANEDRSSFQPETGHRDTDQPGVGNHDSKGQQYHSETRANPERVMSTHSIDGQSDIDQLPTAHTFNWSRFRKLRQYSLRRGKGVSQRSQKIIFLPIALALSISTIGTIYESSSGRSFSWCSLLFPTVMLGFTTTLLIYTVILNHIGEQKSVRQSLISPPLLCEYDEEDGGAVEKQ